MAPKNFLNGPRIVGNFRFLFESKEVLTTGQSELMLVHYDIKIFKYVQVLECKYGAKLATGCVTYRY